MEGRQEVEEADCCRLLDVGRGTVLCFVERNPASHNLYAIVDRPFLKTERSSVQMARLTDGGWAPEGPSFPMGGYVLVHVLDASRAQAPTSSASTSLPSMSRR